MTQIIVHEQKEVLFYEDNLTAIRAGDGSIYISVRQVCDALGVNRTGQVRRIQNHDVLAEGYVKGRVKSPPSASGTGGGEQEVGLLNVDLLPLWLAGLSPKRVHENVRPKLIRFQKEAARILWEAFQTGELSFDTDFYELLQQGGPMVDAYRTIQGMLQLAKNQIILQSQVQSNTLRIGQIESALNSPNHLVSDSRAMQISQSVKMISAELGKRSGRNEFGGVYGELYRRFEITSYKRLPANQFDEAMEFLRQWWQTITSNDNVPF